MGRGAASPPATGAVVLNIDTSNVDAEIIGGKPMKRNGRLVGVDVACVARMAERSRDYLVAALGWDNSRVR